MNSSYLERALQDELSILRSKAINRNDQVNKSAFSLGQLCTPEGLDKNEVEHLLRKAAEENGYVEKDGLRAVLASIRSGLEAGMKKPRPIPNGKAPTARRSPPERPRRAVAMLRAVNPQIVHHEPAPRSETSDIPIPDWTPPGRDGKPFFKDIGEPEPAPIGREIRRHLYRHGGEVVRAKIKYRTNRRSAGRTPTGCAGQATERSDGRPRSLRGSSPARNRRG